MLQWNTGGLKKFTCFTPNFWKLPNGLLPNRNLEDTDPQTVSITARQRTREQSLWRATYLLAYLIGWKIGGKMENSIKIKQRDKENLGKNSCSNSKCTVRVLLGPAGATVTQPQWHKHFLSILSFPEESLEKMENLMVACGTLWKS